MIETNRRRSSRTSSSKRKSSSSSSSNENEQNSFLPARKPLWALCRDVSIRTQKLRKWSSFGHRFGHRSELPFTFQFLRCVHFVHDMISLLFWYATFECFWRLHFVPILTCWMNVFKFKNLQTCVSKSSFFV